MFLAKLREKRNPFAFFGWENVGIFPESTRRRFPMLGENKLAICIYSDDSSIQLLTSSIVQRRDHRIKSSLTQFEGEAEGTSDKSTMIVFVNFLHVLSQLRLLLHSPTSRCVT